MCFLLISTSCGIEPPPPPSIVPIVSSHPRHPSSESSLYPQGRDRPHDYRIIRDEIHYSGWRKFIRRSVAIDPSHDRVIDFDIIDQTHTSNGAVIVFAWNSTSKTATIVREYVGLAAGIVEGKHSSNKGVGSDPDPFVAARCELEEEWYVCG